MKIILQTMTCESVTIELTRKHTVRETLENLIYHNKTLSEDFLDNLAVLPEESRLGYVSSWS